MGRKGVFCGLLAMALLVPAGPASAGWVPAQDVLGGIAVSEPAVAMAHDGDILVVGTIGAGTGNPALVYRSREAFTGLQDFQPPENGHRAALTTDSAGRIWLAAHVAGNENFVFLVRTAPNDADNFTDGGNFPALAGTLGGALDVAARPDDGAVVYIDGAKVKLARWTPAGGAAAPIDIFTGASDETPLSAKVTLDAAGTLSPCGTTSCSSTPAS
jgi:hypothetical protein